MYIKRALLEGFIGINEGTGLSEIDIDFMPAHEANIRNVMMFGRNGCGKSTLMNALTPFPSQGDDRTMMLIPGRPGRKVIEIQDGDRSIKCDIRWSSKGKASHFLYLNGESEPTELTKKGNLGEYLMEVEAQLGITQEFLRIGRVGSRVASFLDLKPSPRKSYIGRFMSEIEDWTAMHKNVTKRITLLKNTLDGLQVELSRIEERDVLTTRLEAIRSRIGEIDMLIETASRNIGSAESVIAEIQPIRNRILTSVGIPVDINTFNPIVPKISGLAATIEKMEAQRIQTLSVPSMANYTSIELLDEKIKTIRTSCDSAEGEVKVRRVNRQSIRSGLDQAIVNETRAKNSLSSLNNSENEIKSITALLDKTTARAAELKALVDQHTINIPEGLTFEQVKSVSDSMQNMLSEISDMGNQFPASFTIEQCEEMGFDKVMAQAQFVQLRDKVARDTESLRKVDGIAATLDAEVRTYKRYTGMHCNSPSCPFEKEFEQYRNSEADLVIKRQTAETMRVALEADRAQMQDFQRLASAFSSITAAFNRLSMHRMPLEAAGVWSQMNSISKYRRLLMLPSSQLEKLFDVSAILKQLREQREYIEVNRQVQSLTERLDAQKIAVQSIDQIRESAQIATEFVTTKRFELEEVDKVIAESERRIGLMNTAIVALNGFRDLLVKIDESQKTLEKLNAANDELNQLSDRWDASVVQRDTESAALAGLRKERSENDQTLAGINSAITRRDEYEGRLAEIDGKLTVARQVAQACNPSKGAPIEFLRQFMDTTRKSVNELLDIALGGEFRIGFELNESEFNIPVYKGSGRKVPDVTETSEGQLALAKTVLSLALVRQTFQKLKGYNIVCFDEIDGMLDLERNRERFAEIVERLCKELNIEQLFMISHNDNFATSPAGIVLFPGHVTPINDPDFMSNKIILADFSK